MRSAAPTYAGAVAASSATVPASFLADGPGTRTVGMLVLDKDGVGHGYTTTITINNVAPTGALANQTVAEGAERDVRAEQRRRSRRPRDAPLRL